MFHSRATLPQTLQILQSRCFGIPPKGILGCTLYETRCLSISSNVKPECGHIYSKVQLSMFIGCGETLQKSPIFSLIFEMMKNFKIAVILSLSNEFISITRGTPPYILYINRLVGMSRNRIRGQNNFWVPARKVGFFWGCQMHPSGSKFKKLKARESSPPVPLLIPPGPNLQRFLCWTCQSFQKIRHELSEPRVIFY